MLSAIHQHHWTGDVIHLVASRDPLFSGVVRSRIVEHSCDVRAAIRVQHPKVCQRIRLATHDRCEPRFTGQLKGNTASCASSHRRHAVRIHEGHFPDSVNRSQNIKHRPLQPERVLPTAEIGCHCHVPCREKTRIDGTGGKISHKCFIRMRSHSTMDAHNHWKRTIPRRLTIVCADLLTIPCHRLHSHNRTEISRNGDASGAPGTRLHAFRLPGRRARAPSGPGSVQGSAFLVG